MTLKHHGAYGAICMDDGQLKPGVPPRPSHKWMWSPDVWGWPEFYNLPELFGIVTVVSGWNPAYDPASGPPPDTETLMGHDLDFLGGAKFGTRGLSLSVFAGPLPTKRDGQGNLRSAWSGGAVARPNCGNSYHASFWSGVSGVGPLHVANGDNMNNGVSVSVPPGEELPKPVWGMVTTFRPDRLRPGWSTYGIDPTTEVIDRSESGINRIRHATFSLSVEADRRDPYFTDCDFDFVSGYTQNVTGTTEVSASLHENMPWAAFGLALY